MDVCVDQIQTSAQIREERPIIFHDVEVTEARVREYHMVTRENRMIALVGIIKESIKSLKGSRFYLDHDFGHSVYPFPYNLP